MQDAWVSSWTRIGELAGRIPEHGFSFRQDGHALSEIASEVMKWGATGSDVEEKEKFLLGVLLRLEKAFRWNCTDEQRQMLGAFAFLAARFPWML